MQLDSYSRPTCNKLSVQPRRARPHTLHRRRVLLTTPSTCRGEIFYVQTLEQSSLISALTLLVGRHEEHPICKNWATIICLERGADCLHVVQHSSWCHCILKPRHSSLASFKSRLVLPFWYRLTQVVLEKRPLNGCSVLVVVPEGSTLIFGGTRIPLQLQHSLE